MVVLEPSCCSVFRDELHSWFPESSTAKKVVENTFTLSEFLEKKVPDYRPPTIKRKAIVQGHCHHKAIMHLKEEKSLMDKMQLDYHLLESGCCGMAGAFGYEKDKYEVSIACGERSLLPEVRKAGLSTFIVADGFSCKEQIAQDTNRHALHLAEVLSFGLHNRDRQLPQMYPESTLVQKRKSELRTSMTRTAIAIAATGLAIAGLIVLKRHKWH
jgi:Fe-S oxidoreductase